MKRAACHKGRRNAISGIAIRLWLGWLLFMDAPLWVLQAGSQLQGGLGVVKFKGKG